MLHPCFYLSLKELPIIHMKKACKERTLSIILNEEPKKRTVLCIMFLLWKYELKLKPFIIVPERNSFISGTYKHIAV